MTTKYKLRAVCLILLLSCTQVFAGVGGFTTSNYLRRTSQVIDTYPFLISFWGRRNDAGDYRVAVSIGQEASQNERRAIVALHGGSGIPFRAYVTAGGTDSSDLQTTTGTTQNQWHHGFGEFVSATSRSISIDNGSRATDTDNLTPGASDSIRIGFHEGGSAWVSGGLAEVSLWDAAGFSDTNRTDLRAKLSAGQYPLTINAEASQPWTGKLVAYYRLNDTTDTNDLSGNGHHLSTVGTLSNLGNHPPVSGPTTRRRVSPLFFQ